MSRAIQVYGFKTKTIPTDPERRDKIGIDLRHPGGQGVTDDEEPDAIGCVVIDLDRLPVQLRYLRVYCR